MTKKTTNLLGLIITILAGTYFYVMYCSECGSTSNETSSSQTTTLKTEAVNGDATPQVSKIENETGVLAKNLADVNNNDQP
ncbi:hypothetical protein [Spongiimicrobium sp. 3-5]|uniref:hypothetical protein n=1 Tax=Spongiimicrobium sp. 3-5 TaxID=3332596 RepID=UPI00397F7408